MQNRTFLYMHDKKRTSRSHTFKTKKCIIKFNSNVFSVLLIESIKKLEQNMSHGQHSGLTTRTLRSYHMILIGIWR